MCVYVSVLCSHTNEFLITKLTNPLSQNHSYKLEKKTQTTSGKKSERERRDKREKETERGAVTEMKPSKRFAIDKLIDFSSLLSSHASSGGQSLTLDLTIFIAYIYTYIYREI